VAVRLGDSPRFKGSEWGSPPDQSGAPQADSRNGPPVGGLLEVGP